MKSAISFFSALVLVSQIRAQELSVTIAGDSHLIDRPIDHMKGDFDYRRFYLDLPEGTTAWVTGAEISYVSPTIAKVPDTVLCHAEIGSTEDLSKFLIVISQGKMGFHFPPGVGIPVTKKTSLYAGSMAIDPFYSGPAYRVTPKMTITYVIDKPAMKSLQGITLFVGKPFIVPPGVHVYRSKTYSFDSQKILYFANVHVHSYAKSVQLIDLTMENEAINLPVKTGHHGELLDTSAFSSEKGVTLYANHSYQMVTTYDNTSDHPVMGMALIYLYFVNNDVVS